MFRVVSTISNAVPDLVSRSVTMAVTPLLVVVSYPVLNIPGNYQGYSAPDS